MTAVGSRDIMDILKELHIALGMFSKYMITTVFLLSFIGKSLKEHDDPLAVPVADRTKAAKRTISPDIKEKEIVNPLGCVLEHSCYIA